MNDKCFVLKLRQVICAKTPKRAIDLPFLEWIFSRTVHIRITLDDTVGERTRHFKTLHCGLVLDCLQTVYMHSLW